MLPVDDWVCWNLKDCFAVHIPAEAKTRLDDDGTTAVIRLGSGPGVTEVLLSNYPLKPVSPDPAELDAALHDILTKFFSGAVEEAFGHAVPFNVEPVDDPDLDGRCAQGVAVFERDGKAMWVARVYARPGDGRFWIMHWNGPKADLDVVMRIFVSFVPATSSIR